MHPHAQPNRRLLVAVDMEHYSRQDNLQQYRSQQTFSDVLREAGTLAGLDRETWLTQKGGDGELAILPADSPEPAVIADFVPAIDQLLRERNRSLLPNAKVRLRVAMHTGLVHLDGANGFPGDAVVEVCRLRDAPPLKRALAMLPMAAVGLIVSDVIYQDLVLRRYGGLRPERFARVSVDLPDKGFHTQAWVYVPDEDVTQLPDLSGPASTSEPAEQPPGKRAASGGDTYTISDIDVSGQFAVGPGSMAVGTYNNGEARR